MSDSPEKQSKPSAVGFVLLVSLLVLSGVGCVAYGVRAHEELWLAIGHALLIAGLLAVTVDGFIKKRLVHEIAVDAQKYLTGYRLPEEIQESISALMRTDIVRRNYSLVYTLTPASPGYVRIQTDFSFEIENLANEDRDYAPRLTLEKERECKVARFSCRRLTGRKEMEFDFPNEAAVSQVQNDSAGVTITEGGVLHLPRRHKDGRPSHSVSGSFYGRFPAESGDVYWFELVPILNVSVRVQTPPEFHFEVLPAPTEKKAGVWRYNRLFLPGDSVRVYWRPVARPTPGSAPLGSPPRRRAPEPV